MRVVHTAIHVSDLDRMKDFFMDGLGFEYVKDFVGDDGVTNFFVRGDGGTDVQFKYDPDGEGEITPSGIAHIAIGVDDTDAVVERLSERSDCEVIQGPSTVNDNVRNAFVEIPDGYVLELEQSL